MSALPALFLFVDGVGKLVKPAPVVEGTVQLGYPESVLLGLGIVLLAYTVILAEARMRPIRLGGELPAPASTPCWMS